MPERRQLMGWFSKLLDSLDTREKCEQCGAPMDTREGYGRDVNGANNMADYLMKDVWIRKNICTKCGHSYLANYRDPHTGQWGH